MSLSDSNNLRANTEHYRAKTLIDTLAIVKMLRKAGFSEEQAEAQAEVISYTVDNAINNQAVTEVKLLETEKRLEEKINLTEKRLEEKIHETEKRLEEKIYEIRNEIHQSEKKILYTLGGSFIALLTILMAFLEFKMK